MSFGFELKLEGNHKIYDTYEEALTAAEGSRLDCDIWLPKGAAAVNHEAYVVLHNENREWCYDNGWIQMAAVYHSVSIEPIHKIVDVDSAFLKAIGITIRAVVKANDEPKARCAEVEEFPPETANARMLHAARRQEWEAGAYRVLRDNDSNSDSCEGFDCSEIPDVEDCYGNYIYGANLDEEMKKFVSAVYVPEKYPE